VNLEVKRKDGTTMSKEAQLHTRENTSLSAVAEKRLLVWLAHRMPRWVNSDHLTVLGFFGMVFAGLSYWLASYYPLALFFVVAGLAINWFGDSLDGTLARVRNKLRPRYGYYVDHVVDIFGAFSILGGLALSAYMSPAVAAGVLLVYLLLNIDIYLATHALGTFRLSFWKLGPTELRVALAGGSLVLLVRPEVHLAGQKYLLFDVAGVVGMVVIGSLAIFSVVRNTLTLYRAETIH
jgi:phosphatidylglycerophosphate synthase